MAAKSFIPNRDADFKNWLGNLTTVLGESSTEYGVTTSQVTALTVAAGAFNTTYQDHLDAQTAAKTAAIAKDNSRDAVTDVIRQIVKQIQANPLVTDQMKMAIAITVPKDNKTPVPIPTSFPIPQIEDIESLTHTLRYADSETHHRAKPDGVRAAEVWMTVVNAGSPIPTDPADLQLVDISSNGKVVQNFPGTDANKTAVYRLRWLNTRNEKGPWGPVVTATIAA